MAIYNNDRDSNEVSWERVVTKPNDTINVKPGVDHGYGDYDPPKGGLTKREYFAAMAMQNVEPPKEYVSEQLTKEYYEQWGKKCVKMADALINALNEQNQ